MKSWPFLKAVPTDRQPKHIYQSDNTNWWDNPERYDWSPIGTAGGNTFRVMATAADTLVYAIENPDAQFGYTLYFLTLDSTIHLMAYWTENTSSGYAPTGNTHSVYDGVTIYYTAPFNYDGPTPKILDTASPYVKIVTTLEEAFENFLHGTPNR